MTCHRLQSLLLLHQLELQLWQDLNLDPNLKREQSIKYGHCSSSSYVDYNNLSGRPFVQHVVSGHVTQERSQVSTSSSTAGPLAPASFIQGGDEKFWLVFNSFMSQLSKEGMKRSTRKAKDTHCRSVLMQKLDLKHDQVVDGLFLAPRLGTTSLDESQLH